MAEDWRRALANYIVNRGPSVAGSMNLDPLYQQHVLDATDKGETPMSRPQWEAWYRSQQKQNTPPSTVGGIINQPNQPTYMKN